MSRSKAQGTAWERLTKEAIEAIVDTPVVRLVEGGMYDRGDLSFYLNDLEVVVECRDRETMQVHTALDKARKKAPGAFVFVAWKRKKRKPGNTVRTQVGRPVAVVDLFDLLALMDRHRKGTE